MMQYVALQIDCEQVKLHSKNKGCFEGPYRVLHVVPNTGPYLVLQGTPTEGASKGSTPRLLLWDTLSSLLGASELFIL